MAETVSSSDEGDGVHPEDSTITITVGEDNRTFHVNEKLLAAHSPFFVLALKKQWKEGQPKTIDLPDDESGIFEPYVQWLQTGNLGITRQQLNQLSTLAKLYVLGEKLMDRMFQDSVIDTICFSSRGKAPLDPVPWQFKSLSDLHHTLQAMAVTAASDIIYRGTPAGSPARRLMVDMYLRHGGPTWAMAGEVHPCQELFEDEQRAVDIQGEQYSSWKEIVGGGELVRYRVLEEELRPCRYHLHDKSKLCNSH